MNKLIYSILLILAFFCQDISAGTIQQEWAAIITKKKVSSCTTSNDSAQYTPVDQDNDGTANTALTCNKVVFASTTTVTAYVALLCDNSATAGTFTMSLYNHKVTDATCTGGGDCPDETSEVAGSDVDTNIDALVNCGVPTSYESVLGTPLQISSGTYWVCRDKYNVTVYKDTDCGGSSGERNCYSANAGASWTCLDDDALNIVIWGCPY